jgi:hypothetical protein
MSELFKDVAIGCAMKGQKSKAQYQGEEMGEQREHKRFAVRDMGINCWIPLANKVTVNDLCMSGISLQANRRFDIGREYAVKLGYQDQFLSLKGTVVWSVLSGKSTGFSGNLGALYKAGAKFAAAPLDKLQGLINMIGSQTQRCSELDSAHQVSRQLPAQKKFQIDSDEKTIVDMTIGDRLKRVSLKSLLLESEREIAIGTRLPMSISIPGEMAISIMGRVAYCLRGKTAAYTRYNIGIEYLDMSLDHTEKLKRLIGFWENKGKASYCSVGSSRQRVDSHDTLILCIDSTMFKFFTNNPPL